MGDSDAGRVIVRNPNDAPRDPPPRSGVNVRLSATGVSGILPRSILGQLLSDDAVCPSQAVSHSRKTAHCETF